VDQTLLSTNNKSTANLYLLILSALGKVPATFLRLELVKRTEKVCCRLRASKGYWFPLELHLPWMCHCRSDSSRWTDFE